MGLSGGGLGQGGLARGRLGSYSRESPREDQGPRDSAASQHRANVAWGRRSGLDVVAFDGDRVSRLTDDVTRYAAWHRLVRKVRAGELDGIIVRDYERVSALAEVQEVLFRVVWDAGGRLCTTRFGEESPEHSRPGSARGELRTLLSERSRKEVEAIRARARQGRREKMAAGGYGGGSLWNGGKYGYDLREMPDGTRDFVPVGGEAADVLRFIRNCPLGPRPLARLLTERGIRRPDGKDRPWAPSTVLLYRTRPDYDPGVYRAVPPGERLAADDA